MAEKAQKTTLPRRTGSEDNSPAASDTTSTSDSPLGAQAEGDGLVLQRRRPIASWRLVLIFVFVGVGLFLSLLDATVVATMLVTIAQEYEDFRTSSWVVLSYTLTEVGFAVPMARLSDSLGRKAVACTSSAIFLAASVGCAASKSLDQLIGFRAVQGVGGAGMYSIALITFPELSPPGKVVLVSSALGTIVAMAGVVGPVLGGVITTNIGWRWVFWINCPCAGVSAIALYFLWPRDYQLLVKVPIRYLDFSGAILVLVGTILPVFIINQAAIREYAWNSAATISILIISGLSWIGLAVLQRYLAKNPKYRLIRAQFPWRIMHSRVLMAAIIDTFLSGFVLLLVAINIPLRAQIVNLYGPVEAGVLLLPVMAGGAFGCALGGSATLKRNNTFPVLIFAGILIIIGSALLLNLPASFDVPAKQWGFEAILGVGVGLKISSTTFIAILNSNFEDHAISQSLVAQARVFGGSVGVASSIIVLISTIQSSLGRSLTPQQLGAFYRSPLVIFSFPPEQQHLARLAFIDAFNTDMYICIGVSAASVVAALFTFQRRPPSLKTKLMELEAELSRAAALTLSAEA
ncbi:Hypothetical protein R9X50_00768000 [Acrodontium crateriforme]|uniref:Major facilitator superfamily (MFS) profile domain-containing protein n=1 Tax=Acrodontium crateriforme TaxID=150365 RepID=A0AAQ3RAX9_9PEZI|nr:Hypothetical protein R9X50_00768000 [Acrodontium crateriforme]